MWCGAGDGTVSIWRDADGGGRMDQGWQQVKSEGQKGGQILASACSEQDGSAQSSTYVCICVPACMSGLAHVCVYVHACIGTQRGKANPKLVVCAKLP